MEHCRENHLIKCKVSRLWQHATHTESKRQDHFIGQLSFAVYYLSFSVYRHSTEVIQKLEHAGLGYHISSEETTDKLGMWDTVLGDQVQ